MTSKSFWTNVAPCWPLGLQRWLHFVHLEAMIMFNHIFTSYSSRVDYNHHNQHDRQKVRRRLKSKRGFLFNPKTKWLNYTVKSQSWVHNRVSELYSIADNNQPYYLKLTSLNETKGDLNSGWSAHKNRFLCVLLILLTETNAPMAQSHDITLPAGLHIGLLRPFSTF